MFVESLLNSPVAPLALHEVLDVKKTLGYLFRRQITENNRHLSHELRIRGRGVRCGNNGAVKSASLLVYCVVIASAPSGHVYVIIGDAVKTANLGDAA